MTHKRAIHWSLLLALAGCTALACSDDAKGSAGESGEATSGGEWNEASSRARKVAPSATTAKPGEAAGPAEVKDYSPKLKEAPSIQASKPATSTGPSLWGAPDAESGQPLPDRPKTSKASRNAFNDGLKASARGDYAGAKTAFEQALAADPRSYGAAYNLGVIADRQGQTNVALQSYSRALGILPDYERAAEATARVYLRQGASPQAVAFLQPLAQRWERNLYLQAALAEALIEANRLDEAEKAARKALSRDERFVPAMVALADASIRRGRLELADSILEQAVAVDANNAQLHFLQGKRHQQEGRLAQALESYRKAVEQQPDYPEARMALGMQYMAAGNYAMAAEQFEAAVRIVPTLVAVHLNLGDAYRGLRRFQDAKREFDTALRMQERLPEAHFNLGLMYMEAGSEFPGLQPLDALQRAILELTTYRDQMGPQLTKDDPAATYIADLQRQIEREKKRIEREAAQKQKEAERAARKAGTEAK